MKSTTAVKTQPAIPAGQVKIELKNTSQPIVIKNAKNTYQKGDLFCVYTDTGVVKFPLADIFRITEPYSLQTDAA